MTRAEIEAILNRCRPDDMFGSPVSEEIEAGQLRALCTALIESMDRVEELEGLKASLADVQRSFDTEYDGRMYTYCTGCDSCTSEGEAHDATCIWLTIPNPPPFEPGSTSVATVPCPDCNRKFRDEVSARQHHRAKHSPARKAFEQGGSNER